MSNNILQIEDLSKSFRSHWTFRPIRAVENVSFDVREGEAFGFLGHNGAGKTTTIKCIVGLIAATKGRILINERSNDYGRSRKDLGFLPEQPYFYDHLSVEETLHFFAALHGLNGRIRKERVEESLSLLKLTDRRRSSVRALSKGLQQRLGLAQAILNKPRLLLLDEPFSGLDPLGRKEIRELILYLKEQGATVFMSSHILSDVENICDRVGVMNKGKLKKVFTLTELPQLFGEGFELICQYSAADCYFPKELCDGCVSWKTEAAGEEERLILRFSEYAIAERTLRAVVEKGLKIVQFQSLAPS